MVIKERTTYYKFTRSAGLRRAQDVPLRLNYESYRLPFELTLSNFQRNLMRPTEDPGLQIRSHKSNGPKVP